ncbi:MAG: CoA transferase [Rhodospirillales bacterium]|nr:CoA transferase [Rhodospirillales bacterium]MBO6786556.1 CoA transferase [Rhodospirillales bacterium]
MSQPFLTGIRVLDLSQFLPGPFATQMLADMGADVVKVEPPKGDPMRALDPVTNDRGASPYHALVNAGKRVVMIDLKSDDGQRDFTALVSQADVLMESYRPGVMERLGFPHEKLRELNPGLVHCALSGYGQNGPMRLTGGHDINYVAAAGQLGLTGPGGKPHMAYPMVADYAGAMQSVVAILGALVGRGRSGQGAYLDVAMADSVLAWQSQALTALKRGSPPARDMNMLTGGAAFYGVYETGDGRFISLGAIETVFWENFCNAVDRPDLISRQGEPLPQTALIGDVAAIFKTRTRAEWDEILGDVDCCYHPVLDIDEVEVHPQNAARGLVEAQPGLENDHAISVLLPFWIDDQPPRPRKPMSEVPAGDVVAEWRGE